MNDPPYLPTYLTDQQRAAVLHQGSPLLIIAGPGSGKTEVLTWRVAHLVRAGLVAPEHLLVTTFTNKAALELKDRIQQKLPKVHVEAMQVGTLHSLCGDLLRRYPSQSSLPRGFHILDEAGQFLFVYTQRKALSLNEIVKGCPHDFFSNVLRLFNLATEELVELLPVIMVNGAKRVLVPVSNRRQFLEVPPDVLERVDPVFYSESLVAALKAWGMG